MPKPAIKKEDVDDDNSIEAASNNDGGGDEESPRRSSRKRKAVSYNEDVLQSIVKSEEDEAEEEFERTPRKRRASGSRKKNNRRTSAETKSDDDDQESEDEMDNVKDEVVSDSSDSEEGEEGDSMDGDGEPATKKSKKKSLTFSCDHSKKSFMSREGLDYHVKNNFCCREGNTKSPKIKKETKKRKRGTSKTKYPKFRGKQEERTCSECGRVFVSVEGLKYHAGT